MTDESLTTVSTEVLVHECTTLAGQIASATCRFLLVVAELDRREAWAEWGCRSMAHFLSWRCSLSETAAREHVRVAHALRSLPTTVTAFARGELSYSKVRALVRVATHETEEDLVGLALTATAAQLEKIIRAAVVALSDPIKRDALRELHTGLDEEGMGTLRTKMRPDELAIVEAAVDAAMPVDTDSAESPIAGRRVDGLVRICESYLATGDAARPGDERYVVVIHTEVDADGALVSAETESGGALHQASVERVLCDSSLHTIIHGRLEPLGSDRRRRTPNRAMRRAIHRRSRGQCEWIGCSERRYVEIHHVLPWSRGGATAWHNLVALCWHHHHLVHEGGWRLELDGRRVRCVRSDGTELTEPITVLAPPLDVTVADDAIVPLWAGERFDLSACVDAVLYARTG